MSGLDELAQKLRQAANNPPRLAVDVVKIDAPTAMLPRTTGTGDKRIVMRTAPVQKAAIRGRRRDEALSQARQELIGKAKEALK